MGVVMVPVVTVAANEGVYVPVSVPPSAVMAKAVTEIVVTEATVAEVMTEIAEVVTHDRGAALPADDRGATLPADDRGAALPADDRGAALSAHDDATSGRRLTWQNESSARRRTLRVDLEGTHPSAGIEDLIRLEQVQRRR